MDLYIIQTKTTPSFQETPVERLLTFSDDLFNLGREIDELRPLYNERLLNSIKSFRLVYQHVMTKFPEVRIKYFYVSRGNSPSLTVKHKAEKLKTLVKGYLPEALVQFEFVGAQELLELARRRPRTEHRLTLAENPISSEGLGFIGLVALSDFYDFITDDRGRLLRHIFEANVRDYQGKTEVNDQIRQSLLNRQSEEDFWWLNNGITILATKAWYGAKAISIENPQIVNGLQTAREIFNVFSVDKLGEDERKVLVRIIVPSHSESADRIIKATNSQTRVEPASLRATDPIQRSIEEYLRPKGLYYDRRKNFYKNEGKPRTQIVSISQMAQAVMSIVLQEPNTARARPSSLLKSNDDYRRVFSNEYPIPLFYVCAEIMRRVDLFMKKEASLTSQVRSNLGFYLAMCVVGLMTNRPRPNSEQILEMDLDRLDGNVLTQGLQVVTQEFHHLGGTDQVAKGSELRRVILQRLEELLRVNS